MRRFKATPQKKFIGMMILFVFIPLFLLLYVLFVIDWRPSADTIVIAAAIAVLAAYLYRRYKKQLAAQPAEELAEQAVEEETPAVEEAPQEEEIEEPEEPVKEPAPEEPKK